MSKRSAWSSRDSARAASRAAAAPARHPQHMELGEQPVPPAAAGVGAGGAVGGELREDGFRLGKAQTRDLRLGGQQPESPGLH